MGLIVRKNFATDNYLGNWYREFKTFFSPSQKLKSPFSYDSKLLNDRIT